jgi:hypothetical protein
MGMEALCIWNILRGHSARSRTQSLQLEALLACTRRGRQPVFLQHDVLLVIATMQLYCIWSEIAPAYGAPQR